MLSPGTGDTVVFVDGNRACELCVSFDNTLDSDCVVRTCVGTDFTCVTEFDIPDNVAFYTDFLGGERLALHGECRTEGSTDSACGTLFFVNGEFGLSVKSCLTWNSSAFALIYWDVADNCITRACCAAGFTADTLLVVDFSGKVVFRETFLLLNREAWFTVYFHCKGVKRTQDCTDTTVGTLGWVYNNRGTFGGSAGSCTDHAEGNCFLRACVCTDTATGTLGGV